MTLKHLTLTELRDNGFYVEKLSSAITFGYADTPEEFEEILNLRLIAHQSWGRFKDKKSPKEMLEIYDEYARHVVCKINDKIVACARIIFVKDNLEISDIANISEIPNKIKKNGFVEFTRICTHPDYRGSDLLVTLLQHVARIIIQSKCQYGVGSSIDDLWPLYKKMGCRKLNKPIDNPLQPGQKLNFMYMDMNEFVLSKHANTFIWNKLFFPVVNYLEQRGEINYNILTNLSKYKHILIKPISNFLTKKEKNRKYQKYLKTIRKKF
ncbi:MAG: GNAT family N-acetyltransferase [Silvanigrellaceae bacterium]|nr:GNAT family N-acetyltransferase [Silvanigrellaceae bacterium]